MPGSRVHHSGHLFDDDTRIEAFAVLELDAVTVALTALRSATDHDGHDPLLDDPRLAAPSNGAAPNSQGLSLILATCSNINHNKHLCHLSHVVSR